MDTGKLNADGNPGMDEHPIPGRVEIVPVTSYYKNNNKQQQLYLFVPKT